jgi:hypothetical protein
MRKDFGLREGSRDPLKLCSGLDEARASGAGGGAAIPDRTFGPPHPEHKTNIDNQ